MISSISVTDFLKRSQFSNIIDIRSIQDYNNNHIPGSKNVPFEKLITKPNKYLEMSNIYYIYCQKGIKSSKAVQILNKMGYRVINIEGGYESWILEK